MAETTSQTGPGKGGEAAQSDQTKPNTSQGPDGDGTGVQGELKRQADEQLKADQERAARAGKVAEANRKAGRPSSAELAERERALVEAEERHAQLVEEGKRAIEARKAAGVTKAGDQRKADAVEGPIGGAWVRFTGNPRAATDDDIGPPFESMRGYRFELDGDAIFVKGDRSEIGKFLTNDHFQTETVSVEDAEDIPDGDVRVVERRKARKTVGKIGS